MMPPSFRVERPAPMSNAERQQRWRDRHRPGKPKAIMVGPDGKPSPGGMPISFETGRSEPMSNAERQRRWRERHRPSKPGVVYASPQASIRSPQAAYPPM